MSADGASGGNGADTYGHSCECQANVLYGVRIQQRLFVSATNGRGFSAYVIDCTVLRATVYSGQCQWYAGSFGVSGGGGLSIISGVVALSGDVGVLAPVTVLTTVQVQAANLISGIGVQEGMCQLIAANAAWGTGGILASPGTTVWAKGATFANAYKSSGALAWANSATTGTIYNGAGSFTDGVSLTAANIDTNGAIFNLKTGARFTAVSG